MWSDKSSISKIHEKQSRNPKTTAKQSKEMIHGLRGDSSHQVRREKGLSKVTRGGASTSDAKDGENKS